MNPKKKDKKDMKNFFLSSIQANNDLDSIDLEIKKGIDSTIIEETEDNSIIPYTNEENSYTNEEFKLGNIDIFEDMEEDSLFKVLHDFGKYNKCENADIIKSALEVKDLRIKAAMAAFDFVLLDVTREAINRILNVGKLMEKKAVYTDYETLAKGQKEDIRLVEKNLKHLKEKHPDINLNMKQINNYIDSNKDETCINATCVDTTISPDKSSNNIKDFAGSDNRLKRFRTSAILDTIINETYKEKE